MIIITVATVFVLGGSFGYALGAGYAIIKKWYRNNSLDKLN